MFFVVDKEDSNLDYEWTLPELPELWDLKDKRALNQETRGSFVFYLLMHKPKCTFYSYKMRYRTFSLRGLGPLKTLPGAPN